VITPELVDQTQNEGDVASFTCQVTSEPISVIKWYFNNTPVDKTNAMKYTISMASLNTTTISSILTIMSLESSDVGGYICNATNTISTSNSSGVLTVNGEFYMYYIHTYICHDH